jgi:hypothetical protein
VQSIRTLTFAILAGGALTALPAMAQTNTMSPPANSSVYSQSNPSASQTAPSSQYPASQYPAPQNGSAAGTGGGALGGAPSGGDSGGSGGGNGGK